MVELHENVEHINTIRKFSPYLFFSLALLIWNIVFTILGVHLNDDNSLDYTRVQVKERLYYASLAGFFIVCVTLSFIKCGFIWCITRNKARSHRWRKEVETLVYNIIFIIMGTLYLAGDNLLGLICSGTDNTVDKDNCIEMSSIILGLSLLLHAALYVAGSFNLKPTASTLPVTGRIRKAYQSILQLAALAIFLDQTFTTVVRLFTDTDIEVDESPNCDCPGNTTTCSSQMEVVGFFAGLFIIMMFIVVGLLVKSWKDYCSCCWKKWCGQCCCHVLENILIFMWYLFVVVFMAIYSLADSSWLYKCTPVSQNNPKYNRIILLCISLLLSLIWIAMYIVIICLPGVGIVWKKKRYLDENDYISVQAEIEESEWVCKNKRVNRKANGGNASIQADESNSKTTARSKESVDLPLSIEDANQADNISIPVTVEENYGSVSITLPIEERITWCQGLCYCWLKCYKKCSSTCHQRSTTDSTQQLTVGQQGRQQGDNKAEADGEMIMFTYLGKKKNVRNATVTNCNGSIKLCADEEPVCDNQSYILIPGKLVASKSRVIAGAPDDKDKKTKDASKSKGIAGAPDDKDRKTEDASKSRGIAGTPDDTDKKTEDASGSRGIAGAPDDTDKKTEDASGSRGIVAVSVEVHTDA